MSATSGSTTCVRHTRHVWRRRVNRRANESGPGFAQFGPLSGFLDSAVLVKVF